MNAAGRLQYFLGSISTSSSQTLNSDSIPMTGIWSQVRCGIRSFPISSFQFLGMSGGVRDRDGLRRTELQS